MHFRCRWRDNVCGDGSEIGWRWLKIGMATIQGGGAGRWRMVVLWKARGKRESLWFLVAKSREGRSPMPLIIFNDTGKIWGGASSRTGSEDASDAKRLRSPEVYDVILTVQKGFRSAEYSHLGRLPRWLVSRSLSVNRYRIRKISQFRARSCPKTRFDLCAPLAVQLDIRGRNGVNCDLLKRVPWSGVHAIVPI